MNVSYQYGRQRHATSDRPKVAVRAHLGSVKTEKLVRRIGLRDAVAVRC